MRRIARLALAVLLGVVAGCGSGLATEGEAGGEDLDLASPPTSLIAPFDPGPPTEFSELAGVWWIETIDGYEVEWGRYAAKVPWIEFADNKATSNLGCNTLMAAVSVDGSKIRFENGSLTEVDCSEPNDAENLMWSEQVLSQLVRSPEGFEVRIDETLMRWQGDGHTATFERKDKRPESDRPPPLQQAGRLDCSPGDIARTEVPDVGQGADTVATAAGTDAVAVEAGDPLQWWGVDAGGQVVVGVFLGDFEGAPYEVLTCE